jgi:hypothetical protein
MGKSTISMVIFNSELMRTVSLPEGNTPYLCVVFSWGHYLQEGIQPLAELAALIHKKCLLLLLQCVEAERQHSHCKFWVEEIIKS